MSRPAVHDQAHIPTTDIKLDDPSYYINRELSWLQFNWRVLKEALDTANLLLERVKFLSIFASNLDEFFMIRVSGLRRQVTDGVLAAPPDGMSPSEQLTAIREILVDHLTRQAACWDEDLKPKLYEAGVQVSDYRSLSTAQHERLRDYFAREIFPTLTPLAFDPAHPFPHISNLSMNLAVVVNDPQHGERFARLKIPDMFPRLIPIPTPVSTDTSVQLGLSSALITHLVWIEEVVAANLDMLFPGLDVVASYPFRITRDADLEIKDDEASDLLTTIEEQVGMRHFGSVVRLELDPLTPLPIRETLTRNLDLAPYQVYSNNTPLGMADLMELTSLDQPLLKDQPFLPALSGPLVSQDSLFDLIRRQDILLYHPYDSFMPIVDFVQEAANDPDVLAIKQTLYRVGANSPIVNALMEARENQKQVAVMLELKARFDEENNIGWARALEEAGVHVSYGVMGLKTHAKMCLVVRREADGIQCYVHMGTGNYNAITSRLYTDLSYFTCDSDIGADASDLFNALTGYSLKSTYRKLLVAPGTMRHEIISRIDREINQHLDHGKGYLAFKMNALVDPQCIQALYRASQAGVKIDLHIRGICCLRPGIPGISETISVISIVGRFLEHARIYHFHNGGQDEVLLGSADLMQRNLDRRVELLFPVEAPESREAIIRNILHVQWRDNTQASRLLSNGQYELLSPEDGAPTLSSQNWLLKHWKHFSIDA